jgi:hypothetical protein
MARFPSKGVLLRQALGHASDKSSRSQDPQPFLLDRVIVEGALTMNPLQVEHDLVEDKPATFIAVDLTVAKINGQLAFSGATASGALMMNDAQASVLHAIDFVWSKETCLHGLTYDRPPGLDDSGNGDASRIKRKGAGYISWLEKDQSYSPQPYEHLAAALYKVGEPSVGPLCGAGEGAA